MAEEVKREYTKAAKWEYYAAAALADLAEISFYFRALFRSWGGVPQPALFKPEYFMQKFTFRTDEVDKKPERPLTEEEKLQRMRMSKSSWFGLVGINQGV